jgi:hypothetical protein
MCQAVALQVNCGTETAEPNGDGDGRAEAPKHMEREMRNERQMGEGKQKKKLDFGDDGICQIIRVLHRVCQSSSRFRPLQKEE